MNTKDREDFLNRPRLDPFGGQKKKRIEIAKRWGTEREPMAVDSLWGVICNHKEDLNLRLASLEAIGTIGDEVAVSHLATILNDSAEEALHNAAITALAQIGSALAVTALIGAWEYVKALVATDIRGALVQMEPAVTTGLLIVALGHLSEQVRVQAEQMLLQDNSRVPLLIDALKGERTRKGAASLLVKMGGSAVQPLIQALGSTDRGQSEAAGQALTEIGQPTVKPLLGACVTKLEYMTWLVAMKPAVEKAFANVSEGDLPLLQCLLKAPDADLQRIAVRALPKAGKPALKILLQIGAGEDARLAKAAQEALGAMGTAAVPDLIAALSEPTEKVRRSAAEALLKTDDPLAKVLQPTLETWRSLPEVRKPFVISPDGKGDFITLSEAVAGTTPGAIIRLSDADHVIRGSIKIDKPIILMGDDSKNGRLVGDENSAIEVSGDGPCSFIGITFSHLPITVSSAQACIYQCHFGESGVRLGEKTQCEVTECEFIDGAVITIEGEAAPLIQNNKLSGKAGQGRGITYESGSGTVRQNTLNGFEVGIAVLWHSADPLLEANVCSHCRYGITYNLLEKKGGIAAKNRCNDGEFGINVLGGSRVILRENECCNNAGAGISVEQHSEVTLERNTCRGNKTGILISSRYGPCKAQDNQCIDNEASGIAVLHSDDVNVCSNTCIRNGQGIAVAGIAGSVVHLIANKCRGNEMHGIHISEESTCLVQSNDCSGNNDHGVLVMDHAAPTLEGNICRYNDVGIRYADQSGGAARSNRCESNRMSGIQVGDYARPTVESNICRQNDRVGIIVDETAQPTLRNNECSSNTKENLVRL